MNIIKLDKESSSGYYKDVACLHIAEIHHGFLPILGLDFMSRLYYELARSPKTSIRIAIEDDKVVGFIASSADIRASYFAVFRRAWMSLLFPVLRSMYKPQVIQKLPAILTYPFHGQASQNSVEKQNKSKAEILAIAVESSSKGTGVGSKLIQACEQDLQSWGVKRVFVATNSADPISNAFYQKVGFTADRKQGHNDMILQVYQKEVKSG